MTVAGDGPDALAQARSGQPDLVVLDLGLPKMDGLDVTRALRQHSSVPIIMLTARVDESDKLVGLELGADDYLTKPFSPRELVARVRAVLPRIDRGPGRGDVVRAGDVDARRAADARPVAGRPVEVTSTEFTLLSTLMRQPGRVFTRAQLLDAVHRRGGEGVRSRRRRAREEPAPQDRSGSARAATPADGLWRRLPVHRRMRREACGRGRRLPGRPMNTPPTTPGSAGPRGDHRTPWSAEARARARFFRRVVAVISGLVSMAVLGLGTLGWLVAERAGFSGPTGVALAALALLAGALVLAAGLVMVRGGTGPLRAVMDAADRVADGDYTVRVREHGPPPVRALAYAFNAMTERLAHADRQRRDLMADVAHELRTPLSVLQGRLEGLLDGVYPRDDRQLASLLEETQVLSRLIEDLRTLALDDAGALRLEREPTDLVGLVRDTVRGFEPEAARHGVTLTVTPGSPTRNWSSMRCASARCSRTCCRTRCGTRRRDAG